MAIASAAEFTASDKWIDGGGGHTLHLMKIEPTAALRGSLLFVPGLFCDGRFFLNSRGRGPARFFLERGFRVSLADLRGHGASRTPRGPMSYSFDEYAQQDLPAFIEAAWCAVGSPLFVLAHSMGGCVTLAALGVRPELQRKLAGVVVLASAVNDYSDGGLSKRLAIPAAAALSRPLGRFPARRLRLGTCDEPSLLMQQFAHWAKHAVFENRTGEIDYFRALNRVELPIFSGVGAGDRFHASIARARKLLDHLSSPDKTFAVFGRNLGASRDFGHVDLVRGAAAESEIFPRVHRWLQVHSR
jgi:pimeloyl-ACP methyl ester carboxylesterase